MDLMDIATTHAMLFWMFSYTRSLYVINGVKFSEVKNKTMGKCGYSKNILKNVLFLFRPSFTINMFSKIKIRS